MLGVRIYVESEMSTFVVIPVMLEPNGYNSLNIY
jgi:hypothetical protein